MDHVKITFRDLLPEQKEILIAQLADAGFEGFEENESDLFAFIDQNKFDAETVREVAFKYGFKYDTDKIAETNWNELWESNFPPVIVDEYVSIRANFHEPITNTKFEIIITPKMSFGTGHHATTHMMIEMMHNIDFSHKSVFDFGTGTGVLAILACKEGAEKVIAIDNDDWSIENAAENFERNNCIDIELIKSSTLLGGKSFDIILANINKNVILENLDFLQEQLNKSGILLLSGLLLEDENEILTAAKNLNLKKLQKIERNNWICLKLTN